MKPTTIGIDVAKEVFGIHAVDAGGKVLVHKRIPRKGLLAWWPILNRAWSEWKFAVQLITGHARSSGSDTRSD